MVSSRFPCTLTSLKHETQTHKIPDSQAPKTYNQTREISETSEIGDNDRYQKHLRQTPEADSRKIRHQRRQKEKPEISA